MHNYYNALLLGISHKEEVGFNREWTYEWLNDFNDAARIVAPSLVDPQLEAGWAGFYENTPDHNAIIGASNTVEGFTTSLVSLDMDSCRGQLRAS